MESLEVEGYPTEAEADFNEANISDLVYGIIIPIIADFRRKTGRNMRLRREKEIVAVDSEKGRNGGGIFVTTGDDWRMVGYIYDGCTFQMTEKFIVLYSAMGKQKDRYKQKDRWMKKSSVVVDCLYVALQNGGIGRAVVTNRIREGSIVLFRAHENERKARYAHRPHLIDNSNNIGQKTERLSAPAPAPRLRPRLCTASASPAKFSSLQESGPGRCERPSDRARAARWTDCPRAEGARAVMADRVLSGREAPRLGSKPLGLQRTGLRTGSQIQLSESSFLGTPSIPS
ncbi:hypothetical protein DFH27DRAFT_649215 [Peziza echinospora]|nr:hypothetical protein DFH27DRAFT_649215 [Peziza echinospora]